MGVCLTLEEALEDGFANTTIASFRPFPLAKREGIISVAASGGPANRLLPGDSHTDAVSRIRLCNFWFFYLGKTALSQFPVSGKEVPAFLKAPTPQEFVPRECSELQMFLLSAFQSSLGPEFP